MGTHHKEVAQGFDPYVLRPEHRDLAVRYIGSYERLHTPDLTIASEDGPYLHRWHLVQRNTEANAYFHIQVADDPDRPLHDHPWDNTSVILVGGYDEILQPRPPYDQVERFRRVEGQVVHRESEAAHRLILHSPYGYSMSLFTTGPHRRPWGFWCPDEYGVLTWRHRDELVIDAETGVAGYTKSTFKEPNP